VTTPPPSGNASGTDRTRHFRRGRRFFGSLKFKLLALIGIFIALPFVLYWQFEEADHKMRDLVTHGIQQQNQLIARALTPSLEALKRIPNDSLDPLLASYAMDGTRLRLILRPRLANQFFYVAAVPSESEVELAATFDEFQEHGISPQLDRICSVNTTNEMRYAGERSREELLTSVIPIQTALGCWVLIASHSANELLDTSVGRSYAQVPAVHAAAVIYLALAALSSLIAFNLWRNIRSFRAAAREVREGRGHDRPFASRSIAPEFASVAADFDGLVADLRNAARDIREAAEDNAHSFKTPLATIEAATQSLKRQLPTSDPRAARTFRLMMASITRLKALILAVERYGYVAADAIDTPHTSVDVAAVVGDALLRYQAVMAPRVLRTESRLGSNLFVRASKGMLEIIVENIVDNAISFSPLDGIIGVSLERCGTTVELQVDDRGPGVDPAVIERIFERYFSIRVHEPREENADTALSHSGVGLWMVRRNVEALGGSVFAVNRDGGGLSLRVILPLECA
jgi:two-component system, OmpR family, sensor histidine kinase ChvG